jgi:DNA replication protein DnaC
MPDIISQLKALKLHGMAECYAEIQAQNPELMTSAAVILRQLLEAEVTDRSIRTIRYQMGSARFPIHRDFSGFDFGQSIVDQSLINKLATMKFTDAAQNLVLVGGTGTGKTHLSTAIGVSGIQNHGKRVRFYSTVELVNTLEQEKAAGKQGRS